MFCYHTTRIMTRIPHTGGSSIPHRYGTCSATTLNVLRPTFPIQVGQVYSIGMASVQLPYYTCYDLHFPFRWAKYTP